MLLLHFLEACMGAFDLCPAYVLELLFCNESTPHNCRKKSAFFTVWLSIGVSSRVYTICDPYKENNHAIPYVMGGYYSKFYSRCNTRHRAQYYDVPQVLLIWVNSRNHFQLDPVLPADQVTPPFDCRSLRHSPMVHYAVLACSTMNILCNEQTFNIMDL